MEKKDLHDKLSTIKPYTFYGDEPPRRLSKEPSKILQPLMEWAEKAHFKKGGLAGHKLLHQIPPPPKRPYNAYKLFFEETKTKLLAKGGKFTREEIQAVTPTIKEMWLDASVETLTHFQSLAKKEAEKYESEMKAYEHAYPEFARQLKMKEFQRKARIRRTKELKKEKGNGDDPDGTKRRTRRSSSASKRVSKWLNQIDQSDLTTTTTASPQDLPAPMDCESEMETVTSSDEASDEAGYNGAYRFP